MNKIALIIRQEYLNRVRKKSFLIMTIVGPLLFAGVMAIPAWLASRDGSGSQILVSDRSGKFEGTFSSTRNVRFEYTKGEEGKLKQALLEKDENCFLLLIDSAKNENLPEVRMLGESTPPMEVMSEVKNQMNEVLRNQSLRKAGIDPVLVEKIRPSVQIKSTVLSDAGEKDSSAALATIIGYGSGFLIYIFIFIYGSQIMMSVMEEKTSRVVELLVSSVKPFQLMLGKIIGVALVGLTQFALWIVLSMGISSAASGFLENGSLKEKKEEISRMEEQIDPSAKGEKLAAIQQELGSVNVIWLVSCFIIYFLGGYLLYSALFAAIGSAVESQQEAQQFSFPVSIPVIFSLVMASHVLNDPNGSLSFWLSVFPFTSPIIMMVRLPFEPPLWQIALSVFCLIGGFLFMVWISGRIFRVGILMYGKKITWSELLKWVRYQ
jgi:ABC-2 type transport system permease protein